MHEVKPIVAFELRHDRRVHPHCYQAFLAPFKKAMETGGAGGGPTNCYPYDYPVLEAGWLAGHPKLPCLCSHCGKEIEKGVADATNND